MVSPAVSNQLALVDQDSANAPSTAAPGTAFIRTEVRARTADRNRREHRNGNRVITMNGNLHGASPAVLPAEAPSSQRSQKIIDDWERRDATPGKQV